MIHIFEMLNQNLVIIIVLATVAAILITAVLIITTANREVTVFRDGIGHVQPLNSGFSVLVC